MKRIAYNEKFETSEGLPFIVKDPSLDNQRAARDKAVKEWKGEPGKEIWEIPTRDCDFAQAIIWFMNNIPFSFELDKDKKPLPPRKLTPEDAGRAYEVIKAFQDVATGFVELDPKTHEWLLDMVKSDGVEAFKPLATQAIVKERLEAMEEKQPKK